MKPSRVCCGTGEAAVLGNGKYNFVVCIGQREVSVDCGVLRASAGYDRPRIHETGLRMAMGRPTRNDADSERRHVA